MKIEALYPEICSLYGDIMNVRYLNQCLPEAKVISTPLHTEPFFMEAVPNLIYMGPMTERSQKLVAEKLMPYKERIMELIEGGTVFLVTGNALEIFGSAIQTENGKIECLDIFPFVAHRKMFPRYNSLYLGKFFEMEIVGFKNQFSHAYGEIREDPLFETVRGAGRNPDVKEEGIRKNNFMGTYLLGPLLVLNPPFMKHFLNVLGYPEVSPIHLQQAESAYRKRLSEFKNPKIEF